MSTKKFTITLSDGTKLTELELNGDNFVSKTEVTEDTFAGKLSRVIIEGDTEADEAGLMPAACCAIGEHRNMELVQIAHYTQKIHGCEDGWYFVLRDIPAAELEKLQTRGDIDYIAMMTGVTL